MLYESPRFPSHPVAAHPRINAELRARVARALLQMRQAEGGAELLQAVSMGEPVAADYRRDYGPLEKLGLERHVVPSQ